MADGGGGGVSLFGRPKGRGESRARRTFQSVINISSPKIVGERGGGWGGDFRTYHFSLTYRSLYNFSVIFS